MIDELNSLVGYKGWFSENYGGEDERGKRPFQLKNTMRLDAIRDILHSNGKVIAAREINYKKNVMSSMRWTNEWINSDGKYNEYLFLLEK